ncbi:hypothetical protein WJX75_004777 [Coccomyxa subellipsoidea]|uniref:BZIP domain-containing protein n=1 Tax=Coccomyxa subellipsoidea TaxID=248742 RepID=A0ABR2YSM5_9CHLO
MSSKRTKACSLSSEVEAELRSSIPISQRSSSQPVLSQSSTDPLPSSQPSRQPPPPPTFSPSRSSLGSGYSLQSAAGDEPGAAESHNPGGGAGGGGPGQPSGGVAYGPGFAGVSDEDLAAMDPKRVKRLVANRQSAQRSKARKLRHIMQLEEEVQTLQGISSQQQATIGGLQQEAALLTASNRQLSVQVADLQEQLHKQEAFTELVTAELRRLSVLAGEPAQLPTFSPAALQEQQQLQAQQLMPGGQLSPQLSDIALQQQLASQYGLGAFSGGGGFQQYPVAQQFQAAYIPHFGMQQMPQLGGMQQMPQQRGELLMEGPPPGATYYQQPPPQAPQQQQQRQSRQRQQPRQQPRPAARQPPPPQPPPQPSQSRQPPPERPSAAMQGAVTPREQGVLSSQQSLERPASAPLPAAVADAAAAAAAAELPAGEGTRSAGAQPPSTEAVRDAAIAALALAERRSVRFSADLPRSDSVAESRRQALATTSRGNTFPLARGDAAARRAAVRTLSAPVPSPAGSASGGVPPGPEAAGGAQPTAQPDPFRVNVPASAFQLEERRSGQDAPAWRQQQQHFPAVPEQEDVQSWQQSQVGWPLGARAQQPYPSAGGPVGNVMQAFRGLSMQGSDPSALPPSGMRTSLHQPLSMQPGGRYGDLSWDDMMRSLSDPVFQTRQDGTPIIPPGMYPAGMEGMAMAGRGPFDSFYNVEQTDPSQQQAPQQQHPRQQEPGDESARQR